MKKKKQITVETLFQLSELFKFFGDSTRIRIIERLLSGETSVSDIAAHLGLEQSCVSHQLRILRLAGLVRSKRIGRVVFYSLDDEHVELIFKTGLAHILHKG